MMMLSVGLPTIPTSNPVHDYVVFGAAILAIGGCLFWNKVPKWMAVIVTMVAIAAAMETKFGPWLGHYLNGWTAGWIGKNA